MSPSSGSGYDHRAIPGEVAIVHPPAASLLVRIDASARGALQQQIYAGIRRAILDGVVEPGTRLPSSRALAEDLGVSRTTTLLALDQLLAEGYLTAQRGSGTFVARELPDDLPRALSSRPRAQPQHPPLSRRGAAMASTPAAARRAGVPPCAFRLGVPGLDLFPVRLWAQLANRRLRSVTPAQLDYGDSAGLPALRDAIADHVRTARGTQCAADQVFVVSGAQRALELIFHLLLDPGDSAWLEEPGFPGARSALVSAGARIVPVRVDAEGLDVAAGTRRASDARLAFVTPSHQFPLGVPMSLSRRLALLQWASAARAWVVEDDYDSDFRHGARPIPCLHGLDLHDRWLAARRAADLHPPRHEQAVLADFIAGGHFDRHLRRMRKAYRERLEALADAVERHCRGALRLREVQTGLHVVADLETADAGQVFLEAATRGVEVMPLSAYYAGRTRPENALVLGFAAVRPEELRRGMERLAAAIEAARRT